ncbi:hypothetical protein AB7M16_002036 [Bradyrhizobium sp. USDA 372]
MTLHKKTEKDNGQGKRASNSTVNDAPGSLLAATLFRQALDRTDMPASAQKIGGFIVRFFNVKYGYAWPTVARIAFECSCSEATVYRAFQENDGPLREWFTVGKVIIDGDERNTYAPNWAKAAAVNREFEIRLEEWKKAHADAKKAANDNRQDRNDVPQGAESGAGASQSERSRPRKMRGDGLSKCETIEVMASNLSDRSDIIPDHSAPGVSARSSQRGRACGADRHSNGNRPAYKQTRARADELLMEIKRVWPKPSEDAEHQPRADSAKAEAIHWHKLLKSGIAASRIQRAALHYLSEVPDGQWPRSFVSFLTGRLPDYLDPDQPDLFIPEDELAAAEQPQANDNEQSSQRMAS